MDYIDYYQVYHPISTLLKKSKKKFLTFLKTNKIFIWLKNIAIWSLIISIFWQIFWITVSLKQEQKELTLNNYIHCIVNKYTKDYK